jgi:PPP family 3-phenylpropionic acid transporter
MSGKASVSWTLKYTILNMAYFAAFCTVHAYAVFIPAGAYYVSSTMEELDQVKGQNS